MTTTDYSTFLASKAQLGGLHGFEAAALTDFEAEQAPLFADAQTEAPNAVARFSGDEDYIERGPKQPHTWKSSKKRRAEETERDQETKV